MRGVTLAGAAIALGLPVFPCDARKQPLTANGFRDATADPATIRRMFAQRHAALIGVPTGHASGIVVIDIDVKNGAPGMAWLRENAHALPETRRHRTRSGGLHLLFAMPDGAEIRNSAGRIAPGVDVRGTGGYVVFPPSPGYSVVDHLLPAAMPRWLIKACLPPPPPPRPEGCDASPDRTARRLTGLVALVATAPAGQRNQALYWAGRRIAEAARRGEMPLDAAKAALEEAACAAGLPRLEARRTINSALKGAAA
jgi:hypothetical protein